MCTPTATPKLCGWLKKIWTYTAATKLLAFPLGSKIQTACYLHSSLNIVMSVITDRLITDRRKQTQTFSLQIISSAVRGKDSDDRDIVFQTNACTPWGTERLAKEQAKSEWCLTGSAHFFDI